MRILAADPKVMEQAYGRAIFDRYGQYAADPLAIRLRRPVTRRALTWFGVYDDGGN
jgi:hypothetical protein